MKSNSKGFTPILIIIILLILGGIGYFAYKNFYPGNFPRLPERTPTCQVNCPGSMPTPKPGTIPGWVKYEDPDGKFSFEYPQNWSYIALPYSFPNTDIPISGLYTVSLSELEKEAKESSAIDTIHKQRFSLGLVGTKLIYQMESGYEVFSKKHTFFGKTDVVTNKYCLTAGTFYKGGTLKAGEICFSRSAIDLGDVGYLEVEDLPINQGSRSADDIKTYEKILSTIKINR